MLLFQVWQLCKIKVSRLKLISHPILDYPSRTSTSGSRGSGGGVVRFVGFWCRCSGGINNGVVGRCLGSKVGHNVVVTKIKRVWKRKRKKESERERNQVKGKRESNGVVFHLVT